MLTYGEAVEVHALRNRGWSYVAIGRHIGRDWRTVKAYLEGRSRPGVRRRAEPDPLERFVPYVKARFVDDPHVWSSTLFDEVTELGYDRSYPSFARQLRVAGLRPHCEACAGVKGRETIEIPHPAGEEMQWDWDELPDPPWGGDKAHLLVGSLPCSGKFRAVFAEAEDQPYLVEAVDGVLRRFGGTARRWRVDRMATVVDPKTGILRESFAPVAKHYAVTVVACPPRRGNRKGSVEKSIHFATQRFWRTMTASTMPEGQAALDRFCERIGDRRPRPAAKLEEIIGVEAAAAWLAKRGGRRSTVADLAALETLLALPAGPYPATIEQTATVDERASVAFRGNRYSVPPGLGGVTMTLRHRLGSATLDVVSPARVMVVTHRLAAPGAGAMVRTPEHRQALEKVVLGQFSTARPCDRKANRPPGPGARAERGRLLGDIAAEPTVDLDAVAEVIRLAFPGSVEVDGKEVTA
jgi:transposase